MRDDRAALFDGLAATEIADVVSALERRRFPAGSVLIAPGDRLEATYLVESGVADVLVEDAGGREHRLSPVTAGATLGEMSFLTGEPAACTVRAATDVDVVVLGQDDFDRLSSRYPLVLRNLGAILSERLTRATRRAVSEMSSRVTVLLDHRAPPLLGYALACSVAWHTRAPTLLLVLDADPGEALAAVGCRRAPAGAGGERPNGGPPEAPGADVMMQAPDGRFAPDALSGTLEDLFRTYAHVLVQVAGDEPPPLRTARLVRIAGTGEPLPHDPAAAPGHTIRGWTENRSDGRPDRDGVVCVDAPEAADEAAMAGGMLPGRSACGAALGWAARDLAGLKVGLALGAGSLKGYAHVGVLRSIERTGLPIDYLAGTSIGSAVAGLIAVGHDSHDIARALDRFAPTVFRFAMPTKGLLSPVALRRTLRAFGPETLFEDLSLPLALVATDLETRREVVFRRGLVWLAVLASTAIPGLYPAQRVGGYTLVDGGVLNPVPSDVAAGMGADHVIAVKLGRDPAPVDSSAEAIEAHGPVPSVVRVVAGTIQIMESKITAEAAAAASVLIAPEADVPESPKGPPLARLRQFSDGQAYIEAGEAATEAALPRLARALPWLRP